MKKKSSMWKYLKKEYYTCSSSRLKHALDKCGCKSSVINNNIDSTLAAPTCTLCINVTTHESLVQNIIIIKINEREINK